MKKDLGHWSSKKDYTILDYRGAVPRKAMLTSAGVEILRSTEQPARPTTPTFPKGFEGLISVPKFVEELQGMAQASQREFVPEGSIGAITRRVAHFSLRPQAIDSIPADVTQWPDPPHIEFANCAFDSPEDVKRFVESYGFSPMMLTPSDALDEIRDNPDMSFSYRPGSMAINVERLKQDQEFLRHSWGKVGDFSPLKNAFLWTFDDVDFVSGKLRLTVADIWEYIFTLFLIDLSAGRLRICEYPNCRRLKYFVKKRADQECCSTSCKNAISSARYYERNADNFNAERREKYSKTKAKAKRKTKAARGGRP